MLSSDDPRSELLNDLFDGFQGMRELWHGLIAQHGLSVSHYMALKHLKRQGSRSMSQLTEVLNVTHGACTNVIDRLTSAGLVERHHAPNDRRVVQVQLTPHAEALLETLRQDGLRRLTELLGGLSPPERAQLAQGFKILANALRSAQASTNGDNHPHATSC
jgi:DNA-binding MarR family transcriptional regulator